MTGHADRIRCVLLTFSDQQPPCPYTRRHGTRCSAPSAPACTLRTCVQALTLSSSILQPIWQTITCAVLAPAHLSEVKVGGVQVRTCFRVERRWYANAELRQQLHQLGFAGDCAAQAKPGAHSWASATAQPSLSETPLSLGAPKHDGTASPSFDRSTSTASSTPAGAAIWMLTRQWRIQEGSWNGNAQLEQNAQDDICTGDAASKCPGAGRIQTGSPLDGASVGVQGHHGALRVAADLLMQLPC